MMPAQSAPSERRPKYKKVKVVPYHYILLISGELAQDYVNPDVPKSTGQFNRHGYKKCIRFYPEQEHCAMLKRITEV